jgi:hypothetical protein
MQGIVQNYRVTLRETEGILLDVLPNHKETTMEFSPTLKQCTLAIMLGGAFTLTGCGGGSGGGGSSNVDKSDLKPVTAMEAADKQEALTAIESSQVSLSATEGVTGGLTGALLSLSDSGEIRALASESLDINIDVNEDGTEDVNMKGTFSEGDTSASIDITMTVLGDFSETDSASGSVYTVKSGSKISMDADITESSSGDISFDMVVKYSNFAVAWVDSSGTGSSSLNGKMSMKMTMDAETYEAEATISMDVSMIYTENGETHTYGVLAEGSYSDSSGYANLTYYVSIDGTTYGPFTESELIASIEDDLVVPQ